ncbi:hypothetical protein F5883DRAFT_518055 [Diaporthe sp. PMI_573]|nr:hypothetical protein F5883DRAFT_518055 [Diaporthaceae sp. PMI_573]
MDNKLTETPHTDQIFWPKWQIKFDDGTIYPASFGGVHLGTVAEKQVSRSTDKSKPSQGRFFPPLDMLFIDDYVFEYSERPDAEIIFDRDAGLPKTLGVVEKVAINASSLSHSKEKDDIWFKKLRFILQNFPNVRAITVLTAIVLDIASPVSMPKPMYFMDIGNTSIHDRMRHGILSGDELRMLPHDPETLRPSDFVVQEWDNLPTEWPMFGKRKVNGSAPELYMGTMVFFGKEWANLDGAGTPGHLCSFRHQSADPMGAIIRREIDTVAQMAEGDTGAQGKKDLKTKTSKSYLKHKGSSLALLRKASTFSLRIRPVDSRNQKTWG